MSKKTKTDELYNQFSLFFIGSLSLVMLYFFGNYFGSVPELNVLVYVFVFLIFVCYTMVAFSILMYYLSKANETVRKSYSKHNKIYWGAIIFISLAVILVCGYMFVPWQQFIGTVFSAGLFIILGAVVWFIKFVWGHKFQKKSPRDSSPSDLPSKK